MQKTILVSAFLSGKGQEKKVRYLEKLDKYLRLFRFRLFCVNTGSPGVKTSLEYTTMPAYVSEFQHVQGSRFLGAEDLSPEIIHAASVEAEIRNSPLPTAAVRLLLFRAFFRRILAERDPHLCVLWHQFNGFHYAAADLCRQLRIPIVYSEYGVMPGTAVFETGGQMAESWVAQQSEKFTSLPVEDLDLQVAERYLEHTQQQKLSRKDQAAEVSIDPIVEKCRQKGRRIIFYAGGNDFQTGMLPTALPQARIHSPMFVDTLDALQMLVRMAETHDWHILFKPHPMVEKWHQSFKVHFPDRMDTAVGANLFDCMEKTDVTTTILSQVCYMALIHNRPSVMLGRNQLSGKGCAYEVGAESEMAGVFHEALAKGFTPDRQKAWMRHVAQLLKYYVFAFEPDVEKLVGRDIDEAARYLMKQSGLPQLERREKGQRMVSGIGALGTDCRGRFHLCKLRVANKLMSAMHGLSKRRKHRLGRCWNRFLYRGVWLIYQAFRRAIV